MNDIKTFEQRMREHRQQYEQQRSGKPASVTAQKSEKLKIEVDMDYMDDMYLHEQEDDKYIVVDHNGYDRYDDDEGYDGYEQMEPAMERTQTRRPAPQTTTQEVHMQRQERSNQPVQNRRTQVRPQETTSMSGTVGMEKQVPETLGSTLYTPGYLKTQIGKMVRVEFLIGDTKNDRTGILSDVGVSYIILNSLDGISKTVCDIYSIKFVTIMETDNVRELIDRIV